MMDSLLEIITESGSQKFDNLRFPLCDKCYRLDWGNYGFSCSYVFLWVGSK